jgi:hypothetical protein
MISRKRNVYKDETGLIETREGLKGDFFHSDTDQHTND